MPRDFGEEAHLQWLGYVQPEGLVVSVPALLEAQAHLDKSSESELHRQFLEFLAQDRKGEREPRIPNFHDFALRFLQWPEKSFADFRNGAPTPDELTVAMPDYGETLRPTYALRKYRDSELGPTWFLLVQDLADGRDFDEAFQLGNSYWHTSAQARMERLLRDSGIPTGLLFNGKAFRLVYAPHGESSGHITFPVSEMMSVAGRPILAALHLLLGRARLFQVAQDLRLPKILENSRKYQNDVSTKLATQVTEALYLLLRGFQSADGQTHGALLKQTLRDDPNRIYQALLTTLMRLVFVLYAEDRGLLPNDEVYIRHYSVTGLWKRLREEHGQYADTMEQRFGAWAHLLTLFRVIYRGGNYGAMRIPARRGYLFDPDRYPFLEGRQSAHDAIGELPLVSDAVVFEVLNRLLVLNGERLSYRSLDVEQIGSVYEAIMGFRLEIASGRSVALYSPRRSKGGASVHIDLDELLAQSAGKRAEWVKAKTGIKLTGRMVAAVKESRTAEDLCLALESRIDKGASPAVVPKGSMILQPSEERRSSGSHYTPRLLTGPIVETTLRPVLEQLGTNPKPEQILSLKVCDPAMGSGAFLVEVCRQLAEHLVAAWRHHKATPDLPPDEEEILHARRIVAQRCLYGVDRNPMAVDLAKLSLWLATLAKDHPFTFLDHSFRCGDSLLGLTLRQIAAFHWEDISLVPLLSEHLNKELASVTRARQEILAARDEIPYAELEQRLAVAEERLAGIRPIGDAVLAAFFRGSNARTRKEQRDELLRECEVYLNPSGDLEQSQAFAGIGRALHTAEKPFVPFHWELEFPEVFPTYASGSPRRGFDAIVGNPPFAGKNTLQHGNVEHYPVWLQQLHEESHGNADLAAHFFRRAFTRLRPEGTFGLIATNTISQGDTRSTGLRWICAHDGTIYSATTRYKWPGAAAVVVSVVHVVRGAYAGAFVLDGRVVPTITAFLFHAGGNEDPVRLKANEDCSFIGSYVLGMGFTFDDTDTSGVASPISEMHRLIEKDRRNAERIFPYLGGEEVTTSPTHAHHRYIINFEDFPLARKDKGDIWLRLTESEKRQQLRLGIVAPDYPNEVASDWPALIEIVERKLKAERSRKNDEQARRLWWRFLRPRPELQQAIQSMPRVLTTNCGATPHSSFAFLPTGLVYSHTLAIVAHPSIQMFAILQSRIHEIWARFLGSSMKDDLRYTPSDCFETFPFPPDWEANAELEAIGKEYYETRASLMVANDEGLTKTYNRFHDPNEDSTAINQLRELHDAMDRAVLKAYGWDLPIPPCEFLLDYEDEDDEEDSRRRKPWRYRWPDDFRDEVLARLLQLNQERAQQEALEAARATTTATPSRRGRTRRTEASAPAAPTLFAMDSEDEED